MNSNKFILLFFIFKFTFINTSFKTEKEIAIEKFLDSPIYKIVELYGFGDSFLLSVKYNRLDLFNFLLSVDESLINYQNNFGITALMVAVSYKNKKLVDRLLEFPDIDIHKRDRLGINVTGYAAFYGYFSILDKLIKNGGTFSINDIIMPNRLYFLSTLFANPINNLISYLARKDINIIDFNSKDEKGYTMLMYLIFYSTDEMIKFLLKNFKIFNINLNVEDNDGNNLLTYAIALGKSRLVKKLLKLGAKINQKSIEYLSFIGNIENIEDIKNIITDKEKFTSIFNSL